MDEPGGNREPPAFIVAIDESGQGSSKKVYGALKLRAGSPLPGKLAALRAERGVDFEFHFTRVQRDTLHHYKAAVDLLLAENFRLVATVLDPTVYDPFKGDEPHWRGVLKVDSQILVASLNRHERASVVRDWFDLPPGVTYEGMLRATVNRRLGGPAVTSCLRLNSKSTDLLQMVDLLSSSVRYYREGLMDRHSGHKAQLVRHLLSGLNMHNFDDTRTPKLSIQTLRGGRRSDRSTSR